MEPRKVQRIQLHVAQNFFVPKEGKSIPVTNHVDATTHKVEMTDDPYQVNIKFPLEGGGVHEVFVPKTNIQSGIYAAEIKEPATKGKK